MQADPIQATESGFPHSAYGLHPAEDGFDPFAHVNAHGVAGMPSRAPVDGRALPFPSHMGSDVPVSEILDKAVAVVALVCPKGDALATAQIINQFPDILFHSVS